MSTLVSCSLLSSQHGRDEGGKRGSTSRRCNTGVSATQGATFQCHCTNPDILINVIIICMSLKRIYSELCLHEAASVDTLVNPPKVTEDACVGLSGSGSTGQSLLFPLITGDLCSLKAEVLYYILFMYCRIGY